MISGLDFGNVGALLSSPLGQIGVGVALFFIAKRFPAFQSLAWYLLDALKIPRPNVPSPSPAPGPTPSPDVPDPAPSTVVNPAPVADLLSQLLAQLLAKRQHNAAAALVEMARTLESEPVEGSKA